MTTTVARGRNRKNSILPQSAPTPKTGLNTEVFAAAMTDFELQIYGSGGTPLYDLISNYGEVVPSNSIDTAFQSFSEVRATLNIGEAGFIYSEEYNRFTLALIVPKGGVLFSGLLHDRNGAPRVEEELFLCRVRANQDFKREGETIITKGQEFLKALPASYVDKLEKAA